MRKTKRLLALVLTLVLTVSIFTACGENKENKEEEKAAITATAVKFSKDGKYTTTVKSDKYDLSEISAKNVEISYVDTSTEAADEALLTADSNDKTSETQYVKVKVDSVKANSDGGYDITFTDKNAALNPTSYYNINFTKLKVKEDVSAEVEYPEITLTPDIEFATPSDKKIKVSLTLKGSKFEDKISDSQITLGNAFKNMDAKVISSSDKNLTLELKGKVSKNEAGAYQWGAINVKASAVKDAAYDVSSKIEIKLDYAGFDASSLKYSDEKVTADLNVYGVADISKLTKDNVKVDDATVEAVEKKDNNTLTVTLTAKDINSVNDLVDIISGKQLTVDGYKTEVILSQSTFYPVFDYVEDDADSLKLTLKLYSFYGEFDKDINTDQFSFSDGFKGAKADSVKVDEDGIATLIISVPANGQKSESLSINGTVTVAAEAFVNAWGEKASKESSYTRSYSNESMGKEITLNTETLLEIKKYTRNLNTTFGKISHYAGMASKAYSIGKSILEALGVLESAHAEEMRVLNEINGKLDTLLQDMVEMRKDLKELKENSYKVLLQSYEKQLDEFNASLAYVLDCFELAGEEIADEYPEYEGVKAEDLSDEDAALYQKRLMDYIIERSRDEYDDDYGEFNDEFKAMKKAFEGLTSDLSRGSSTNPLTYYDELCALTYNFDTQSYDFRLAQRVIPEAQFTKAMSVFAVRYNVANNPTNKNYTRLAQSYTSAMNQLETMDMSDDLTPSQVIKNESNEYSKTYISEIYLSVSEVTDMFFKDKGFTKLGQTLNGISIGYKTTTDYKDAIKSLTIKTKDYGDQYGTESEMNYRVHFGGDKEFANSHGNLNYKGGSEECYLYYTKDDPGEKNKAVYRISIDKKEDNAVSKASVNGNYLHMGLAYNGAADEFRPYSYVLGKKVMWKEDATIIYPKANGAALVTSLTSARNWTDEEVQQFESRIQHKTLKEELAAAGIITNSGLATKLSVAENHTFMSGTTFKCTGDLIMSDKTTVSKNVEIGSDFGNKDKYTRTRKQDFIFLYLDPTLYVR